MPERIKPQRKRSLQQNVSRIFSARQGFQPESYSDLGRILLQLLYNFSHNGSSAQKFKLKSVSELHLV